MNPGSFEHRLRADGYDEIETKQVAAGTYNAVHDHSYDVRAMVLDGEITLIVDGDSRAYRQGDEFTMAAACSHAERIGAEGVRYLVGRRRAGG